MKLQKLLSTIEYEIIQGTINTEIDNICWDSRSTTLNSLFICVQNRNVDRHAYARAAINNGAIALVVEHTIPDLPDDISIIRVQDSKLAMARIAAQYYGDPSKEFNLIGVTGTNGKTSVTYYISKLLESAGRVNGLIGTISNTVGNRVLKTAKLNPTTPDSIELQKSFREIAEVGATDVVMEVTSSALDRGRVNECYFDLGIFTNLTQDHLEEHGTMENYKKAKLKLFSMCKTSLINADDPIAEEIVKTATGKVYTYGVESEADFRASNISFKQDSVEFNMSYKGEVIGIKFNVPGDFSVYNALAAIGACVLSGIDLATIIKGLDTISGVPGRVEKIPNERGILVVVDYAHSPDSLENIIKSMRKLTSGKVITVFGCGGNRDRTKRPIMGKIAGRLSDFVIITSDNPRKENPSEIISEIEEGIKETACPYLLEESRKSAIFTGLNHAKPGDVVIVAGKGHETYQIIGEEIIHFDDREVVAEYFRK